MKKRNYLILASAGVVSIIFVAAVGLYTLLLNPFMDDGPFHGKARESAPVRHPDQVFNVYDRFTIEVYDPETDEPAPTVLLRDKDSHIKWCVYAVADGYTNTAVRSIRFSRWDPFPFWKPRVFGVVDWTFGSESSCWFISRNGELKAYWYSW
jgi:hypothetical protein